MNLRAQFREARVEGAPRIIEVLELHLDRSRSL